ncbi:hypothetical protein PhCBS80983_g00383 [Powellomyces hirtus]|uniref:Ubiquitin-like-conjugating enzyme ATG10 n=1 Tax=Powellomyces hirtus TaxID=109895 RepID=A0A507EER2_9FUNG|nr:hypothetical protein PhCBS80983_g00383 [Powellomyces hirtus]
MVPDGDSLSAKFQADALSYLETSRSSNNPWTLVNHCQIVKTIFNVVRVCREETQSGVLSQGEELAEEMHEEHDLGALPCSSRDQDVNVEFHVIYSQTWQVPVMYFSAWTASGSPLSLDELKAVIKGGLPEIDEQFRTEYGMPVVSQQDHPVLGVPFFTIHPCQTAALLKELTAKSNDPALTPLMSWMSVMGTVFHPLPLINLSYFQR